MNAPKTGDQVKLLPHQAAFIDGFFRGGAARIILLRAATGLGKNTALVALASEIVRRNSTGMVLVVTSQPVVEIFANRLNRSGIPPDILDRYRYRELLDAAEGLEPWRKGAVTISSDRLVTDADVLEAIAKASWEAVIVDEPPPDVVAVLGRLTARAGRIVISTSQVDSSLGLPFAEVFRVDWSPDALLGGDGRPLTQAAPMSLMERRFALSESELLLLGRLHGLEMKASGRLQELAALAAALKEAALESPMVFESGLLMAVADRMGDGVDINITAELQQMILEEATAANVSNEDGRALSTLLVDSLREFDAAQGNADQKLAALDALINELQRANPDKGVVIVARELETCFYVAADLEARSVALNLLTTESELASASAGNGSNSIFITDFSALAEAMVATHVSQIVLYDLPPKATSVSEAFGLVNPLRGERPLSVFALVPANDPTDTSGPRLDALKKLMQV